MATSTKPTGAGVDPPRESRRRGRRYVPVAIGLLAIVAALAGTKFAQVSTIKAAAARAAKAGPPPETVNSAIASEETWDERSTRWEAWRLRRGSPSPTTSLAPWRASTFNRVRSSRGASAGGARHPRRAWAAHFRARQDGLAETNARRTRALFASGAFRRRKWTATTAALDVGDRRRELLSAAIQRKVVRAPFAGKLGIRLVNDGQYLAAGTPITVIESGETTFVDFLVAPARPRARLARHAGAILYRRWRR